MFCSIWPVTFKRREKLLLRWRQKWCQHSLWTWKKAPLHRSFCLSYAYQAETNFKFKLMLDYGWLVTSLIIQNSSRFGVFFSSSSCQFKRKMIILKLCKNCAGGNNETFSLRSWLIFERTRNSITKFHLSKVELQIEWNLIQIAISLPE